MEEAAEVSFHIRPLRPHELSMGEAFVLSLAREWVRRLTVAFPPDGPVRVELARRLESGESRTVGMTARGHGDWVIYLTPEPHVGQLIDTVAHEYAHVLEGITGHEEDEGDGHAIRQREVERWMLANNRWMERP